MARHAKDGESAPELVNDEQLDPGQAQEVAEDALHGDWPASGDSRRGGRVDPGQMLPDDVPDLVEKMNDMLHSGRIDNDAYAGEPAHDDEEAILGAPDAEDEAMARIADTGHDPLADMAGRWNGEQIPD